MKTLIEIIKKGYVTVNYFSYEDKAHHVVFKKNNSGDHIVTAFEINNQIREPTDFELNLLIEVLDLNKEPTGKTRDYYQETGHEPKDFY